MKVKATKQQNSKQIKTVKLDTKAKTAAKKVVAKVTGFASRVKLDGALIAVSRLYKAWKAISNADYQNTMIGGKGIANVRGAKIGASSTRKIGQDVWFIRDDQGIGFLIGKQIAKNQMHCGNTIIEIDVKKIVSRFGSYAAAVAHAWKVGETNIKGCAKGHKAISTGDKYAIVTDGKRLSKIESGTGTGNYRDYLNSTSALSHSMVKK